VDVQEDRLPVLVKAWAPGEENYTVYYTEIYGDPGQQAVWDQLDVLLATPFEHASGRPLYIDSVGIDTGFHTQAVYNYCRARPIKTMAIKGASVAGKPIINGTSPVDVTWQGEKEKDGCLLWMIGTDTAKAQIYASLGITKAGPGFCHFPIGLEDEFYKQLTAEKKITEYHKGFPKPVWMKIRPRNEVLDCSVYAYAAALRAGMAHFNWTKIRAVRIHQSPGGSAPKQKRAKKQQPQRSRW
jgi:phage terminase large subunit GpA-like protein